MAAILQINSPAYMAPTRRRRYFSARGAAEGEARAMLDRKYPRERAEYEGGYCTSPSYHWSEDERLNKVHERLSRLILKAFKAQKDTP